jgi:hypothetical protein
VAGLRVAMVPPLRGRRAKLRREGKAGHSGRDDCKFKFAGGGGGSAFA